MIIEHIVGRLSDIQPDVRSVDPLELAAEQRQRPHLRARTRGGKDVAISMPRGVELNEGDVLLLEHGSAVVVVAAAEDLLEVTPRTPRDWGAGAYQLGNLHRDVRFLEGSMLTPYDAISEEVLRGLGVPYQRLTRSFTGERYGAYLGHDHGAADYHAHDHDHEHPHR
ncbi:MAG: urease accessory protein UreE [Burkholderiales bacterium]